MSITLEQIIAPLEDKFEYLEISSSMPPEKIRKNLLKQLPRRHRDPGLSTKIHAVLIVLANEYPISRECTISLEELDFNADPPQHICLSTGEAYKKQSLKDWCTTNPRYISPRANISMSKFDRNYLQSQHGFPVFKFDTMINYLELLPTVRSQITNAGHDLSRMKPLIDEITSLLREERRDNENVEPEYGKIFEKLHSKLATEPQFNQGIIAWFSPWLSTLISLLYVPFKVWFLGTVFRVNPLKAEVDFFCAEYKVNMYFTEIGILMKFSETTEKELSDHLFENRLQLFNDAYQAISISNDALVLVEEGSSSVLRVVTTLYDNQPLPLVQPVIQHEEENDKRKQSLALQ